MPLLCSRAPSPRPSSQARICDHHSRSQRDPPRARGSQADPCSGMRSLLFAGFRTAEPLAHAKPALLHHREGTRFASAAHKKDCFVPLNI